jgi:hypothetical protein
MSRFLINVISAIFTIVLLTGLTWFFGGVSLPLLDIDYTFTLKNAFGVTLIIYYLCVFLSFFGDRK